MILCKSCHFRQFWNKEALLLADWILIAKSDGSPLTWRICSYPISVRIYIYIFLFSDLVDKYWRIFRLYWGGRMADSLGELTSMRRWLECLITALRAYFIYAILQLTCSCTNVSVILRGNTKLYRASQKSRTVQVSIKTSSATERYVIQSFPNLKTHSLFLVLLNFLP